MPDVYFKSPKHTGTWFVIEFIMKSGMPGFIQEYNYNKPGFRRVHTPNREMGSINVVEEKKQRNLVHSHFQPHFMMQPHIVSVREPFAAFLTGYFRGGVANLEVMQLNWRLLAQLPNPDDPFYFRIDCGMEQKKDMLIGLQKAAGLDCPMMVERYASEWFKVNSNEHADKDELQNLVNNHNIKALKDRMPLVVDAINEIADEITPCIKRLGYKDWWKC